MAKPTPEIASKLQDYITMKAEAISALGRSKCKFCFNQTRMLFVCSPEEVCMCEKCQGYESIQFVHVCGDCQNEIGAETIFDQMIRAQDSKRHN